MVGTQQIFKCIIFFLTINTGAYEVKLNSIQVEHKGQLTKLEQTGDAEVVAL